MTRNFTADRRRVTGLRLSAQRLTTREFTEPVDVAHHMLALQAQDFSGAKWSIGLRMARATDASIESALAVGSIVRSWPMRGTLHIVAADDLGWILGLTGARGIAAAAGRHRQLGLETGDLAKAESIARRVLASGPRGRAELLTAFERDGLSTAGQRAAHLLVWLAQSRVTVFGPVDGKQHTFALADDWITTSRELEGEEALAELATRYFRSHGPATERDLAWWSSLTLSAVRTGIAAAGDRLEKLEVEGTVMFHDPGLEPASAAVLALPGFDEYLLGYSDRTAALHADHSHTIVPGGNGMFMPTLVVDGEVVGTWRRTLTTTEARIELVPFHGSRASARRRFARAIHEYAEFLGRTAVIVDAG